jgi:hypothetical protein
MLFSPRAAAVALLPVGAFLMTGSSALALTADQVWQSWKDAGALAGLTVSAATEANSGGVLTLNGITIAPAGAPSGFTISDMTLTENGDGSVAIVPGADMGVDVSEGDNGFMMKLVHDGLVLTARDGDGGAGLVYDYTAASLTANFDAAYPAAPTFDEATPPGQASTKGSITFEGLNGSYTDTPGDNRTFGVKLAASKLAYDVGGEDATLGMKTQSLSETADVVLDGTVTMPSTIPLSGAFESATTFGTALDEGLGFAFQMSQGVSTGSASQADQFFPYEMTMTAQPGTAQFAMDKARFAMTSEAGGVEIGVTTAMAPAPIRITAAAATSDLLVPVRSGDAAGDYKFAMNLSQFTLNEEAWALFDPTGQLKRDPADIVIDIGGKAMVDFVGMAMAEEAGQPPATPAPETLDIRELTVKIAGAALAATGAFTFDNSIGVPMPVGSADVSLSGGNALIDGLIATGLMTEEDAMGARMMMGMFFTPGADADTLTSTIEAKAGGEIWVNGQRVQ